MIDFDPNQFEAELRGLRPTRPDPEILEQVRAKLVNGPSADVEQRRPEQLRRLAWSVLRWLVPAATVACGVLLLRQRGVPPEIPTRPRMVSAAHHTLKADKVEIDRQLMTNFDAIARLPSGEPVRFRCEEWMDRVRVHDSKAGLVLERRSPRLEILPIRFETY
jgi:hypothetical protein